jgi:hypothetical protein
LPYWTESCAEKKIRYPNINLATLKSLSSESTDNNDPQEKTINTGSAN